ncbi:MULTISPECIES: hypothetical protein [unclassified Streptomyces]|uniref:hypothetical protein n=1 Tax=unclassified Streptomyces TaxID=2593676 RepID=UPI0033DAB75C
MGWFSKIAGDAEDRAAYRDAKDNLARISRRDRPESDDYLAAHDRVIAAEQHLPRWRRPRS